MKQHKDSHLDHGLTESHEVVEIVEDLTFSEWLTAAGREDSTSEYDLRAAWRAGENPSNYR